MFEKKVIGNTITKTFGKAQLEKLIRYSLASGKDF